MRTAGGSHGWASSLPLTRTCPRDNDTVWPGRPITRLTRSATGGPAQSSVGGVPKDDDVARADAVEVVGQLVDHDAVADLQRRLHGARRDGVGGHHEGAEQDRHDHSGHEDADELENPARGRRLLLARRLGGSGTWSPGRRGLLGGHDQEYDAWTGQAGGTSEAGLSRRRRHNEEMVRAVIFDFYGTLARWADGSASYASVFADHGYTPDAAVLDGYFSRYDGIEHGEHSVSEEAYEVWVRSRLRQLTRDGGVDDGDAGGDRRWRSARSTRVDMVAYPEAAATLGALREAGLTVGVCSNWGWELDAYLEQVGLLALVDSSVTSARAGARKPHPNIYRTSVESLGVVDGRCGVRRRFVGARRPWAASPGHDMRCMCGARPSVKGFEAPELEQGDRRVGDLSGVLEIVGLS